VSASAQSKIEAGGGDLSIARFVEEENGGVQIQLSDGEVYRVAADAPELRGLEPHRALSPEQLEGLHAAAQRREIARRVFGWLERRAQSRGRMRRKLLDLEFAVENVEVVLDQFESKGLIDDDEYSRMFVRDQLRSRPVGMLWLLSKLYAQGVDRSVAERVLGEVMTPEVELDLARRALEKRSASEPVEKSLRFLKGRGFRASIARRAAAELFDGNAGAGG
jgi:regulatory protein